jgi:hypothetical protein
MLILAMSPGVGRIQGGWPYVVGAYAVAFTVLATYAVSLWLRRPKAHEQEKKP